MRRYIKSGIFFLIITSLLYISNAILNSIFAFLLGNIIDAAVEDSTFTAIYSFLKALLILLLCFVTYSIGNHTGCIFAAKAEGSLRDDIIKSVFFRGIIEAEKKKDSYFVNMLLNDANIIRRDYFSNYTYIFLYGFSPIVGVVALVLINWKAAIIFSVLSALPLVFSPMMTRKLAKKQSDFSVRSEEYTSVVNEYIQGRNAIIQNYAITPFFQRFRYHSYKQLKGQREYFSLSNNFNELNSTIGNIGQLGCIIVGAVLVMKEELSVGELIAAIQLLNYVIYPISNLISRINEMRSTKPIRNKIEAELKSTSLNYDVTDPPSDGNIAFENVTVWYLDEEGNKTIIQKDFSLKVENGENVAILGESGKGKTTLVKCFLKMIDTYDGIVKIGGTDIKEFSEGALYKKVAYVPQNVFIYNDTIRDNIVMYRNIGDGEYEHIIKVVGLNRLCETQKDVIGENGDKLSAGERQRIGIARALLAKPTIIIFDEPTASLDPETRNMINNLIMSIDNCTKIIITHDDRKEYLSSFDQIIRL